MKKIQSKEQILPAISPAIMLDINDANVFIFYALERESKKENRDELMISYLIAIAKKLPVSNYDQLQIFC